MDDAILYILSIMKMAIIKNGASCHDIKILNLQNFVMRISRLHMSPSAHVLL